LWLTLLVVLAAPGTASASIIPISDARYIEMTEYMGNPPNTVQTLAPDPSFSFFDASLQGEVAFYSGQVSQTSSITSSAIQGIGSGDGEGPEAGLGVRGLSVLDVTFAVDSAQPYELSGTLGSWNQAVGGYLTWYEGGVSQFTIYAPFCDPCSVEQFESVSMTLALSPGTAYRLVAAASNFYQPYPGSGSFDITLQAVPEPSTAMLVLVGLAGLAATWRRT
jgi:hypothetical protein